jgi:hypothetical protein
MHRESLTPFNRLPYKSYDSVFVWESGASPERPRHCKRGGAKRVSHWRNQRWEGSFHPKKREPGDRLSSRRFASTSKERSITIPDLDQTIRLVSRITGWASSSICSDADPSRFSLRFDANLFHCISSTSEGMDPRTGGKQFDLELTCEKQFAGEMLGKRGEKPPLPCNCKRPFFDCTSHCPSRVGRRSRPEVGRESGDRSRQAHSPLFLGRRRTLNVYSDVASFSNTSVLRASGHVVCVFCKGSIQWQSALKSSRPPG